MDQTYGFIEVWLAEILNIEFLEYALENRTIAAAVDQDGFSIAFNTVNYLWEKLDKEPALQPSILNSNIHGMRIAIHRYWVNDDLLNDLTGEDSKASEIYLNVVAIGISGARFHFASIKDEINNRNITPDAQPTEGAPGAANGEAVPEEEVVNVVPEKPKKIAEWIIRMSNIMENVQAASGSTYPHHDVSFDEEQVRVVVYNADLTSNQVDTIADVAKNIKKSIICLHSSTHATRIFEVLKSDFNMTDLSKYVLFFIYGISNESFILTESSKSLCYGYEINEIYSITGTQSENKALNDIRSETGTSEEDKRDRIDKILRERKNSPVYKYDGIFKDTVTHVIWAVKDRCVVYFLVPYSTGKNKSFYKIAYQEFVRRYSGSLPYNELVKVDIEHMERRHTNNREAYVKFAVESSSVIIDQIKKKRDEHQSKYKEHLDQAMEHAKMFQRFHEQVEYFNEDAFMEGERKKANENYDMTLAIDKISAITVKESAVHVYTNNIYAEDERTKHWHDIGTFHIIIGMHSNSYDQGKTIKIKNTKHQINVGGQAMNAPHVWQNGTFCHGNLANGMTDAYKRRNLFEVVYQIVLFLESANTSDSAGEKVNRWPEVSKDTATNTNRDSDAVYEVMGQLAEAEKKFDEAVIDMIPIHIN